MTELVISNPKKAIAQIKAADALTTRLEVDGIRLNASLIALLKKNPDLMTDKIRLQSLISKSIYSFAGGQAGNMASFIPASTGIGLDDVAFATANATGMFVEVSKISSNVVATKSFQAINQVGGVMSNFVMGQVDATQTKYRPRGQWVRHVNAGACDWCVAQVGEYEATRRWLRHSNCRCAKILVGR